jgi:hypothetical protein
MMADFEAAPMVNHKNTPRAGGNKPSGDSRYGKLFKHANDLFKRFKI